MNIKELPKLIVNLTSQHMLLPERKYFLTCLMIIMCCFTVSSYAQYGFGDTGLAEEGLIRIAGPGQLADTLNLWGDVGRSGRYLVPRGTTVDELISYSGGPGSLRLGGSNNPWSKVRLKVNISYYDEQKKEEAVKSFQFKYSDPVPLELRRYELTNEQIVSVEVKKKPAFIDYLGVIGPILGTITSSYFIYDQIIK